MSEVKVLEVFGQVYYIDGFFVGFVFGDIFDVINLVMEEVVIIVVRGGVEDVVFVVKVVKEVFDGGEWFYVKLFF